MDVSKPFHALVRVVRRFIVTYLRWFSKRQANDIVCDLAVNNKSILGKFWILYDQVLFTLNWYRPLSVSSSLLTIFLFVHILYFGSNVWKNCFCGIKTILFKVTIIIPLSHVVLKRTDLWGMVWSLISTLVVCSLFFPLLSHKTSSRAFY